VRLSQLSHFLRSTNCHNNSSLRVVSGSFIPDRDQMAGLFSKQAAVYAAERTCSPSLRRSPFTTASPGTLAPTVARPPSGVSNPTPSMLLVKQPHLLTGVLCSLPLTLFTRRSGSRALRQRGGHGRERGAAAARRSGTCTPLTPHPGITSWQLLAAWTSSRWPSPRTGSTSWRSTTSRRVRRGDRGLWMQLPLEPRGGHDGALLPHHRDG
jgi:hypothetical protein